MTDHAALQDSEACRCPWADKQRRGVFQRNPTIPTPMMV